jgi:uncharacterized protein (DUF2237 family)
MRPLARSTSAQVSAVASPMRHSWCTAGAEDRGSHTICAVVTADSSKHPRSIDDLPTRSPTSRSRGLVAGDR